MSFPAHETVPVLTAQALADLVNAETALITKLHRQQEELSAALREIDERDDISASVRLIVREALAKVGADHAVKANAPVWVDVDGNPHYE